METLKISPEAPVSLFELRINFQTCRFSCIASARAAAPSSSMRLLLRSRSWMDVFFRSACASASAPAFLTWLLARRKVSSLHFGAIPFARDCMASSPKQFLLKFRSLRLSSLGFFGISKPTRLSTYLSCGFPCYKYSKVSFQLGILVIDAVTRPNLTGTNPKANATASHTPQTHQTSSNIYAPQPKPLQLGLQVQAFRGKTTSPNTR